MTAGIAVCCLALAWSPASARTPLRRSVVKIYATVQSPDYGLPWRAGAARQSVGSGFIIAKRRIMTNAHIVSDVRFLEVQKDGDAKRYVAQVDFVGHDCDLALLRVEDPAFFAGTRPMAFGRALPQLNDAVTVLGYPLGGERMSLTQGVVSRIDYSVYSHSAVDYHLVLQVDAAINPGNSGGPVTYRGKVIGVAFQSLQQGENIGYAIPLPVITHFLDDIADGTYNGYPELGVGSLNLRNPALKGGLGLAGAQSGVALYYVDPFGSAKGTLQTGDVLLSIDGHDVADDGTIELDGETVEYSELFERKQWGDAVSVTIWRDGREQPLELRLTNPPDPFTYRNLYDRLPEYVVLGGLVFSPLTRNYARTLGSGLGHGKSAALVYYMEYAKIDGLHEGRDEFVILIRRLAHRVNTYADGFVHNVVSELNGQPIRRLADIKAAAAKPLDGFHVIRFEGRDDFLVLKADDCAAAQSRILSDYGLAAGDRIEKKP
ncbi:MAG: trypsin-like peptidase domain-containing protein [Kiritimatiellae bacterium]|nr:trypsin-like peptidase domain-containing protein [Kiritimatiellia bacterium]